MPLLRFQFFLSRVSLVTEAFSPSPLLVFPSLGFCGFYRSLPRQAYFS